MNKEAIIKEITNNIREIEELSTTIKTLQNLQNHHIKCLHKYLDEGRKLLNENIPDDDTIIVPMGGTNKE